MVLDGLDQEAGRIRLGWTMITESAIIFFIYIKDFMARVFKDYPCEYCSKLCKKRFYRAFCSDKCRLIGQAKKDNTCWIWQGRTKQDGYGSCTFEGKEQKVHRVSYKVFKGDIGENLLVLHSCHKPLCINPDHLRLGTAQDNAYDTIAVNHQRKGEGVGTSKLTEQQVLEIRRLREEGMTQIAIAKRFNVNQTLVGFIVRRVRWKHI